MSSLVGKTILNRYHVQDFIGRGGMAEVYKVWDSEKASHFAMKVLLEDFALDRVFIRRFKREAKMLAELQHPNIVRFYDFINEDRIAGIVMDYVEGGTLKHLIYDADGKSMPYEQILDITRSVCSALAYAHSAESDKPLVVHCDIKPANIMIAKGGKVLLGDFGIARISGIATETMTAGVSGTAPYMAPEQIKGLRPVPQTDIYALGVVLYEMFTGGERPFTGEQAPSEKTVRERVLWEHLSIQPPSPRRWNPSLSADVEAVILKCLEKNPGYRYQTALELYNALKLALSKVTEKPPIVNMPPEDGDIAPPPPDRDLPPGSWGKPLIWILPILALVIVLVFSLRGNSVSPSPPPVSSIPSSSLSQDVEESPNPTVSPQPTDSPTPTVFYTPTPILTKTNTPMNAAYLSGLYKETLTFVPANPFIPSDYECADKEKLLLSVGQWARTARYNMSIYEEILDLWDGSVEGIRPLPKKERIQVFDGPVCSSGGQTWWFVKTESSQFGWVIEYARGGYGNFFTPY